MKKYFKDLYHALGWIAVAFVTLFEAAYEGELSPNGWKLFTLVVTILISLIGLGIWGIYG